MGQDKLDGKTIERKLVLKRDKIIVRKTRLKKIRANPRLAFQRNN